jgi:hypothetical protein
MKGTVQEDDYRTEVRFKDENLLKVKILASSGSQSTRICRLRIRDSDPDLNPDPGLNRWHQSGGGSAAHRWIRPGLRYHQSGLGHSTYVGTSPDWLPWPTMIGKENVQFTRIERKRLESAFTEPSPGAALMHGLFGLFTVFLWTFRTRFLP